MQRKQYKRIDTEQGYDAAQGILFDQGCQVLGSGTSSGFRVWTNLALLQHGSASVLVKAKARADVAAELLTTRDVSSQARILKLGRQL
jgi:hypothetical protein